MNDRNDSAQKPKRGRPRSQQSHQAVLKAAHDLVEESGDTVVTMEAIARRAGVGKQTLYKWWGSPGEIFLEILNEQGRRRVVVDDVSREDKLEQFLKQTFQIQDDTIVNLLKASMSLAITDSEFRDKFLQNLVMNRRDALKRVLNASLDSDAVDLDLLVDMIFGLMWYRLLLKVGPLNDAEAEKMAALIKQVTSFSIGESIN